MAKCIANHAIVRNVPGSRKRVEIQPGQEFESTGNELNYLLEAGACRLAKGHVEAAPQPVEADAADDNNAEEPKADAADDNNAEEPKADAADDNKAEEPKAGKKGGRKGKKNEDADLL